MMTRSKKHKIFKLIFFIFLMISNNFVFGRVKKIKQSRLNNKNLIIDKIIARIDDEVIFQSDLDKAYVEYLASFRNHKDKNIKLKLLKNLIISKLFLIKGNVNIEINHQMLNYMLKEKIMNMLSKVGGKTSNLESATGMSMRELKKILKKNIHDQFLISRIQDSIVKDIKINTILIKQYIEKNDKNMITFPKSVVLKKIDLLPAVLDSERKEIIKKLNQIRSKIVSENNFEKYVSQFSEDETSVNNNGYLGFPWEKGQLSLTEYENAAINLKINEISKPVESQNNFYLIKLFKISDNKFYTKHILIKSKNIKEQKNQAKNNLILLRDKLNKNKKNHQIDKNYINSVFKLNVSVAFLKNANNLNRLTANDIPNYIDKSVLNSKKGDIFGPIPRIIKNNQEIFSLIVVDDIIPQHKACLEYDYEYLVNLVKQNEREKKLKTWIAKSLKETKIYIDPMYKNCNLNF